MARSVINAIATPAMPMPTMNPYMIRPTLPKVDHLKSSGSSQSVKATNSTSSKASPAGATPKMYFFHSLLTNLRHGMRKK
jgi:hypothetical protein